MENAGIDSGRLVRAIVLGAVLLALGCTGNVKLGPDAVRGRTPDGYVEMKTVAAAYIGSGTAGDGTLFHRGREYRFTVGGLGIGGLGVSEMQATGEVYGMSDVAQFAGAYAQGRYGFAIGTASGGDLWLQNGAGVIMHLKAKREGLMLTLGGDAVVITMK
ncbi:hypothetical protein KGQ64_02280 [bacterium]|nr:hypothetical protein [bacterium]